MTEDELREQGFDDGDVMGQIRQVVQAAYGNLYDEPMELLQYRFDAVLGVLKGLLEELDNTFDRDRPVLKSLIDGGLELVKRYGP